MNKKIGLGVLAVLIVIAGAYVFKHSDSLVKLQKDNKLSGRQTAWFTVDGNGGCTTHSGRTGTVKADCGGKGPCCVVSLGDSGVTYYFNTFSGPGTDVNTDSDPGTPNDTNTENNAIINFPDQKGQDNFLDWTVYTTKTCFTSFADVEPYLGDQNYVGQFVSDVYIKLDANQPFPWKGASDACKSDGTPVAN